MSVLVGRGVVPRMNKFEQVSSHGHQMPLARGPVQFLISGLIHKMYIMSKCIEVWVVSHLGLAKLVNCNQIPDHVADQDYIEFIAYMSVGAVLRGSCTMRSGASWVMVTWKSPCEQTDIHEWKHYLPTTSSYLSMFQTKSLYISEVSIDKTGTNDAKVIILQQFNNTDAIGISAERHWIYRSTKQKEVESWSGLQRTQTFLEKYEDFQSSAGCRCGRKVYFL